MAERIDALADRLPGLEPRWRRAFHDVPRHLFVPDRAWRHSSAGDGHPIDRAADPEAWLAAVYSDAAIITQFDDGAVEVTLGQGRYTSSTSAPRIVAAELALLDPYDGDEVLEIGTGTGWTAALLAHRLGPDRVTSVEIDPAVLATAEENLRRAGRPVRTVLGDGAKGWPDLAPYDRVHVTCGVSDVPHAWVEQARPGAVLVMPWMPRFEGGHFVRLVAVGDGTAVGRFHGTVNFMPLRSQRWSRPRVQDAYRTSDLCLDPRRVVRESPGAGIAISALLPDLHGSHRQGANGEFELSLWSADSEAQVTRPAGPPGGVAAQRGPRDLWQELATAFLRWVAWGAPGMERFGLTVTPTGQHIWLDAPHQILTRPPTGTG
ncbi:protein-L-isoaspartate O-methyltransferase [Sphaerisporangium rufum]|uniref:Protein-L-isoaspartate O-methyltransferase n=1 Tax=Sphaerisporangium rufum TaxID=1381558 RepID=A0A919V1I1_9ACTN|nr:methyltransferase domain-containing protein [Sphaerisporangium rufum]GII81116.1 protein-L-isoaspartate O-methyltransferase [Sphaerisporangium rufum]